MHDLVFTFQKHLKEILIYDSKCKEIHNLLYNLFTFSDCETMTTQDDHRFISPQDSQLQVSHHNIKYFASKQHLLQIVMFSQHLGPRSSSCTINIQIQGRIQDLRDGRGGQHWTSLETLRW